MENKLKEVVDFAIKRGWDTPLLNLYKWQASDNLDCIWLFNKKVKLGSVADGIIQTKTILFDHSFAKAVFGEDRICRECDGGWQKVIWEEETTDGKTHRYACGHDTTGCPYYMPAWEYHLQQAVLSDDPISYYYNFINNRGE